MILLESEAQTLAFGAHLASALHAGDAITLSGDLGAGKTALARGVLHGLGFDGDVPSPSFPIVIPYSRPHVRLPLWHVDLYRIENAREIQGLVLEDALHEGGALIIEWPERLHDGAWRGALALTLKIEPSGARRLTASVPPSWESRWPLR